MKRRVLRPVAVGIATLSTVATMVVGAVSSQAADIASFSFTPASGLDSTPLTLDTSAPCPGGTNFQIAVNGTGFPAGGYNVTANNPDSILPINAAGGYTIGLLDTMQHFALAQTPAANLAGNTYTFVGTCKNSFGATTFGTVSGQIKYDSSLNYTTVAAVVPITTTTALASTPASPVNTGASVTFTAQVTGTPATPAATGTVQLMDGAAALGSPTAIDGTGKAVISTSFATAGSHSITAVFTGSAANIGNSTSPAVAYTVNQAPATPTTTALAISPATATSADNVTLTATVGPAAAAGKVQFSDGGVAIGNPVTVAGGTAALTQTFAEGPHSFSAAFTPSVPASYAASASTSQAYTVTHFAGVQGTETLETVITPGSLVISVANTSKVILPSPVLNATATYLTTTGPINPVTVTDTRAGDPGWVVNGQVSDFVNTNDSTKVINGFNLGWVPNVIDSNGTQIVQPGGKVDPATPPVVADLPSTDGHGLKIARQLAKTDPGHGTGTAHLGAALTLNVPTTVAAGTYDATLTLTAI